MPHSNPNQNPDILFEKTDAKIGKVSVLLIWMFVITSVCSLLMIPLTAYLWNSAQKSNPATLALGKEPAVTLEVLPSQELEKMHAQIKSEQRAMKIKKAMEEILQQGLPSKK